jgi:hypothetical protein
MREGENMIKGKKACCLIAAFLILTILCSFIFAVKAQIDNSASAEPRQLPQQLFDPVTSKIQEFRSQGITEEQITVKLAELGMGWYPKTGATWMGRTLTTEELAKMPTITPAKSPSDQQATSQQAESASCMRTNAASWTGVSSEIISGSMSVSSGQTTTHYVCMQLGGLDGATNWVETVVTHNYGEAYKWYTYDSDEGGMTYYMDKNTPSTATDTYVIMLDGTQDSGGWHYDVWINYQWVRRGHLSNLWVQAGFQKEVYSSSGQFTNDASHAIFYRNWLHNAQGWSYWTNAVNTWWYTTAPVRETHVMGALSYRWETWVQN